MSFLFSISTNLPCIKYEHHPPVRFLGCETQRDRERGFFVLQNAFSIQRTEHLSHNASNEKNIEEEEESYIWVNLNYKHLAINNSKIDDVALMRDEILHLIPEREYLLFNDAFLLNKTWKVTIMKVLRHSIQLLLANEGSELLNLAV